MSARGGVGKGGQSRGRGGEPYYNSVYTRLAALVWDLSAKFDGSRSHF